MTNPANNPLYDDLQTYAAEMDQTVSVLQFVNWLRDHRPDLRDLSDSELQAMAYDCICQVTYDASA